MGTEATNLPKLAAPARRALQGAGYTRLEDLTKVTESDVMRLHGMGPNAMQVLRNALREGGLSAMDELTARAGERAGADGQPGTASSPDRLTIGAVVGR